MLVIATVLSLVTAVAATIVYAKVDANRPLTTTPSTTPRSTETTRPPVSEPSGPTTSRAPENLSQEDLTKKVGASVRLLETLDEAGRPVQGTAFVVGTFGGQTYLATSYALVKASTHSPAPKLTLGGRDATLWTWQENRDLALLVLPGSIETLPWANGVPKQGDKVWVGGAGQKLSVGIVTGASDDAIDHNVFIDDVRQGAPLVNQKGEVVGIASRVYNSDGHGTDTVFVAIPIKAICERVLRCGGGNTSADAATTTAPKGTTTTAG